MHGCTSCCCLRLNENNYGFNIELKNFFFSLNLITTINLFIDEASEMMDLNF